MKIYPLIYLLVYSVFIHAQTDQELNWPVPEGWEYVGKWGQPEIFHLYNEPGKNDYVMEIYSHMTAAILAKNISMPLSEDVVVNWNWRVDRIPSMVAEDTAETHDYISVAVLFDNGQDISYVWSRSIPEGTSFRCPLPEWTGRETHVIIRTGEDRLSQWVQESRNLKEDYKHYIGGETPGNISQVWLITVSMFQNGTAKATVKDITLEIGKNNIRETVL